jgi:hypothetical protein
MDAPLIIPRFRAKPSVKVLQLTVLLQLQRAYVGSVPKAGLGPSGLTRDSYSNETHF